MVTCKIHVSRATSAARDVWTNLSQNWIHFFWLTAETLQTLAILVYDLENKFMPHVMAGRKSVLTVHNQVQSIYKELVMKFMFFKIRNYFHQMFLYQYRFY